MLPLLEIVIVTLIVAASAIYLVRYFMSVIAPKQGCAGSCKCKVEPTKSKALKQPAS